MINPVQIYSNLAQKIQLTKIQPTNIQPQQVKYNFATRPDVFVKSTENIDFTGKIEDAVRSLGHVECPCCGIKMLTNKDMSRVKRDISAAPESKEAIKVLKPYEEFMHPVEKECFNILKDLSAKDPEANFQQLLVNNMESYHTKLLETQNKIMDEVDELAKNLSPNEAESVKKITVFYRELASGNEKEIKFKRKTFIADVEDLKSKISNKDIHSQMVKVAEKMPTSSNDVNAFVIKYSNRNHSEIAQRLLKLSVGTIEHIKPQSNGGRDNISNYLLECGACNHTRSSIPLGDWVDEHPQMIANTQKYIDKVIEFINNGGMPEFKFYPSAIQETLLRESDGKLDVKVEGLKEEN